MSRTNQAEIIEKACRSLLRMFESGEMPEAITRTFIEASKYDKPSNKWSLGNKLLMLAAETGDARGYDQWQKVGRNVRKGAKAFYIFGPLTRKLERKNEETGEKEEKVIITGFHVIPVFRYEDTEGKELPEVNNYEPKQLPPLYEVAERFGLSVLYSPKLERVWGYYSPAQNKIVLHTQQEKTLFHELGHAVHAKFATLKVGQDAEQEIIAEFVACVLCNLYGIEGFESHAYRYISGYAETENPQMMVQKLMKVLAEVEQCLKLILENASVESLKRIIA
jgi:antirestriction protein ArdC